MAGIVDWGHYSSLYSKIKETDFDRAETLADKEVRSLIGPIRWANITADTFGFEILQDCICKTMDKMADSKKSGRDKGLASISNEGYTETYVTQTEEEARADLHGSIRQWLSGTGLVRAY